MYGKELILDLHNCNSSTFSRKSIEKFLKQLCKLISMKREDIYFWDYEGFPEEYNKAPDHLKGTSCVQFIKTSTIVIHTLDILKKVFINIFSCKEFNIEDTTNFVVSWFGGEVIQMHLIERL